MPLREKVAIATIASSDLGWDPGDPLLIGKVFSHANCDVSLLTAFFSVLNPSYGPL
jgi:hypothetical protein